MNEKWTGMDRNGIESFLLRGRRRRLRRHLHVTLQAHIHVHFRVMQPLRGWNIRPIKHVIQLNEFGVFQRGPTIFPCLHQLANRGSILHRAVFARREYGIEHSRAVVFHEQHILVKLKIMCDDSPAPVGGVLEIKECDIDGDTARTRQLACYSMDCGGLW